MPQALALQMQDTWSGGHLWYLFSIHPNPWALIHLLWALAQDPWWFLTKHLCFPLAPKPVRTPHRIYHDEASHFVKWLKMVYRCYRNDPGLVIMEFLVPMDTPEHPLTHFSFAISIGIHICLQTHTKTLITIQHLLSQWSLLQSTNIF